MNYFKVRELEKQAALLKENEPEKAAEIDEKREAIEQRVASIQQPLEERKLELQRQKRVCQFLRDCEEEHLWIEEKMRQALSPALGSSLVEVNSLQRKLDTMSKEVDNHDQRIQQVVNDGEQMIREGHERANEFGNELTRLAEHWKELREAIEQRRVRLDDSQRVQQYLFDCSETEAWMAEQELYMMSDAATSSVPLPPLAGQPQQQQQPTQQPQQFASSDKGFFAIQCLLHTSFIHSFHLNEQIKRLQTRQINGAKTN